MELTSTARNLSAAVAKLKQFLPVDLINPKVAIICGSGLSGLGKAIIDPVVIHTVTYLDSSPVRSTGIRVCLSLGDWPPNQSSPCSAVYFHVYEGYALEDVTFPIKLFSMLGCKTLILTNAAGSLNPSILTGSIVVLRDHISFPGLSCFPGTTSTPPGTAYSRDLRKLVFHAAHASGLSLDHLAEGTYSWVTGPTYETAAEAKFLRDSGADVVGASTVPEVQMARTEGMDVLALSLVTNMVTMPQNDSVKDEVEAELASKPRPYRDAGHVVSHEEVLTTGLQKGDLVQNLIIGVLQRLTTS